MHRKLEFILTMLGWTVAFYLLFCWSERSCLDRSVSFENVNYSIVSGCMIELDNGNWIPLSNYRAL